jgi:hypothetical protein
MSAADDPSEVKPKRSRAYFGTSSFALVSFKVEAPWRNIAIASTPSTVTVKTHTKCGSETFIIYSGDGLPEESTKGLCRYG